MTVRERSERASLSARSTSRRRRWWALVTLATGLFPGVMPSAHSAPRRDEQYGITIWTIENGLPQGSINDLVQTDDGALWIATFAGLLRFDGIEFRAFDLDTQPDLPSVRITGLERDGSNGLWLLSQNGWLVRLQDDQVTSKYQIADPAQDLISIVRSPGAGVGDLWLRGTAGRLWLWRDGTLSSPITIARHPAKYGDMCVDGEGRLVFARNSDLVRVRGDAIEGEPMPVSTTILAIASGGPGHLWLGLQDGLAIAREGSVERVAVEPPFDSSVRALADDGAGGVWVGTAQGVHHVVPGTTSGSWRLGTGPSPLLPSFDVQSLLFDQEQNLWVGSRGAGLARVSPRRVEVFYPSSERSPVAALASDGGGGVWVSLARGSLLHATVERDPSGLESMVWSEHESPAIFALHRTETGRFWASGERTLTCLGDERQPEITLPSRVGPVRAAGDDELWVSVDSGRRVVRVTQDGVIRESIEPTSRVIAIALDGERGLWLGEADQVEHYHEGRLVTFGTEQGIPRGDARGLLVEPDGGLWVATYGGGLAYVKDRSVTRIARAQGLPNLTLSHIQDDGLGRLWLLSNKGLIVVARDDLRSLVSGRIARIDPVVIGPWAGMPEGNFGTPAGCRDEQGRLWFGTIEGPVRVDPRLFPRDRNAPRVRFEGASADDDPLEFGSRIVVPPATRRLVVRFTTFSLTAPEQVHFRYRLDGFDDAWNESGTQRSASYTSLKPGSYSLRVEARNQDGVWSVTPSPLILEVEPSWWETNSFRTLLVFLVIASLYAIDRVRIGIIQRRARALLEATEGRARAEERESRLREELAHVGRVATAGELATSLAHEVNQPLAAIVTNAQAGQRYLASDTLDKRKLAPVLQDIAQQGQRASEIIQRLREFLRKHKSERRPIDLNQVVRDTLPLVRRELQDQRVDVLLDLDPDLRAVDADPIQMQQILVNLVNNACEAMSGTRGDRSLEIRTRSTPERVTLEVQDSGPGFSPEVLERLFQPYVTTKSNGMGLGLAICRSIVEAHGGRIDAEGPHGSGATFRVDLPAHAKDLPST